MQSQEAMQKISEIYQVIGASNRAFFSGPAMILIGLVISLVPLIEYLTQNLSFGVAAMAQGGIITHFVVHVAFYWGLIYLIMRFSPFKEEGKTSLHPLIKKAFNVAWPFLLAVMGVIFSLTFIEQYQLIYPIVLILLGLLFSVYGSFLIPAVSMIAFSYILVGVTAVVFSKYNFPNLWIFCVLYHGISYIVMGFFLGRGQRQAV